MALIGEMHYLTIGGNTYSIPTSGGSTVTIERALTSGTKSATISVDGTSYDLYAPTPNAGTVTSVRVQATSPVQSSTSTAQSSSLNTTISLANGYGDTKNPYGTKTANYVLAGPSSGSAAAPSFRALVAADIPDLSGTYLTSHLTGSGAISVENGEIKIVANTAMTDGTEEYIYSITNRTIQGISGFLVMCDDGSGDGMMKFFPDMEGVSTASRQIISSIPTKVSQLTNDSGFITSYTETDPTVPSWAKASTKPTYTASEVGAVATSAVGAASGVVPLNASSKIDSTYLPSYVDDVIEGYYYNNKFYTTSAHTTQITGETGKIFVDLSTNKTYRYSGSTFTEVSQGSIVSVSRSLTSGTKSATITVDGTGYDLYAPTPPTVPTNVSAFTNDAGYITSADVPEGASAYTGTISAVGISASTGTNNGFARGDHVHNITKTTINSVLGTGSGTTKFYREDGTWATPAYTTNTDTKLQVAAVTSGTTYYPIVGTGTTAATRQFDTTGFSYQGTNGTTSAIGCGKITLGNSTASGIANNKQGQLVMYGSTAHTHTIKGAPTKARTLILPDADGTFALTSQIPSIPTSTENATTGITASTTATKTTLGTASSIYGVGSTTTTASKASGGNGTAPSWVFEEVSIPNVTAAGSASTWTFEEKTIPNVTAAGSASTWTFGATTVGDGTLVGTVDSSDSSMLVITAGTKSVQQKTGGGNGTAPTLGTAIKVQSKSGGGNGTAPTIGTAIKVQSKKSGSNGSASTWSFTDVTVPIKDSSATSVPNVSVASATVSITDPGHAHTI